MLAEFHTFGPWTWDGDLAPIYLLAFGVACYLVYEAVMRWAGWYRRRKHPEAPRLFGEQRGFEVVKPGDATADPVKRTR